MKKFTDICKMNKYEVKEYMYKFLKAYKYNVIAEDGFLYAKGDVPVMLLAHTDTVHKELVKTIIEENDKISSPEGIGGDDRCGIFMIMNIVKELHCSVLLCDDEETGGIGARKFTKSKYAKEINVNYLIEFDRKGSNDAVFYECDNKEFTGFVCDNTGFKEAYGTFSDISVIAPVLKTAAVNLSCGYYNAHTTKEYVLYDEMMDVIDAAKSLIKTKSEHFEYIKRKSTYGYNSYSNGAYNRPYGNSYGNNYGGKYGLYGQTSLFSKNNNMASYIKKNLKVEAEVVYLDIDTEEEVVIYGTGDTKAEALLDVMMSYPEISFSMIVDVVFS